MTAFSASAQIPTPATIDEQIAVITADADLDPVKRDESLNALDVAKTALTEQQSLADKAREFAEIASNADATLAEIESQRASLDEPVTVPNEGADAVALASALSVMEAERASLSGMQATLRAQQTKLSARGAAIPGEIAKAREALAALTPRTDEAPLSTAADVIATARQTLTEAAPARLDAAP
ncbi:MAG: hypothetical protein HC850_13380 [Rhodomicrobium sp.]|nr:hypothetical protein [Rhodomicrobium sp.]